MESFTHDTTEYAEPARPFYPQTYVSGCFVLAQGGSVLTPTCYLGGNTLLDLLLSLESEDITRDIEVLDVRSGDVLLDTNVRIENVYFPISMMISTTTLMRNGSEIEVGTIGREGMSGLQLVLGINHVPGKAICQISGAAARLSAGKFTKWIDDFPRVRAVMLRYIQATLNTLEIAIACNALHPTAARCARWLLITADRVNSPRFWLTQEFLAVMLGVRRATVNTVERELQELHAIQYARGHVEILDRAALEQAACECYQLTIDRYNELLRQTPVLGTRG